MIAALLPEENCGALRRRDGGARTAVGRVTVELLQINDPFRVEVREELMEEGLFPPE